jgi:hypothetical protein
LADPDDGVDRFVDEGLNLVAARVDRGT